MWIETQIQNDGGRVLINLSHFIIAPAADPQQTNLIFYDNAKKRITINTPYAFIHAVLKPFKP